MVSSVLTLNGVFRGSPCTFVNTMAIYLSRSSSCLLSIVGEIQPSCFYLEVLVYHTHTRAHTHCHHHHRRHTLSSSVLIYSCSLHLFFLGFFKLQLSRSKQNWSKKSKKVQTVCRRSRWVDERKGLQCNNMTDTGCENVWYYTFTGNEGRVYFDTEECVYLSDSRAIWTHMYVDICIDTLVHSSPINNIPPRCE